MPIRFTYCGSAFTNTGSLQGKAKEVTQLGAELMMDDSVYADAEMIAMVIESLKSCGLTDFQITVGEVEYFKGICEQAGLSEEVESDLRDFISAKNYFGAKELLEQYEVAEPFAKVLLGLADTVSGFAALSEVRALVSNERSLRAIDRLEQLLKVLQAYDVSKYISFDLGLLSKYNYYTGIVFKGYTYGVGDAIVNGGRYDRLLSCFGKDAPAIGFMIVVDDLMEALSRQNLKPQVNQEHAVLYYDEASFLSALKKALQLRKEGKAAELIPIAKEGNGGSLNE